ncbi:MAG: aspartate ammonia-lyase [Chloroflexi bacterium]|nr:aspartate ammonia-lyase [Chloroflexota bacterium]
MDKSIDRTDIVGKGSVNGIFRTEHDSLGEKLVLRNAYYGVQTARAIENFPISGLKAHPKMIVASAIVKRAAAEVNMDLGQLDPNIGKSIVQAAQEIIEGRLHDQFMVDVFQAGAGTSHNMNTNEVIANRACEILGGNKGDYSLVHPNDHVNMAQSTNDVFPTAMRIAALFLLQELYPSLAHLESVFDAKADAFDGVIKSGRTHMQDAVPIRLGQEFAAYATSIRKAAARIKAAAGALEELNLGATAAGTGLNSHPKYRFEVARRLGELTGFDLRPAENLVEATQSTITFAEVSASLKLLALDLIRIANDLRLMSSGPKTGFGEINLPPVQPGSSIMPGKVNPVMAEVLNMVAFQVVGNDTTISLATQAGQFELNVMMPVIAFNLFQSIEILTNVLRLFADRCVAGITANVERCRQHVEESMGLATALNPYIGYEMAAKVAQESLRTGKPIREIVLERGLLSRDDLDRIMDPWAMTEPGIAGKNYQEGV